MQSGHYGRGSLRGHLVTMRLLMCALLLLLGFAEGSDKIIFKRVDTYDWVYDDKGSGSDSDVSIWRPKDYENGYYALGDAAVSGYSAPMVSSIMVKDIQDGKLKPPTGFVEIWRDRGSGGDHDVRVMYMVAESGYTCIGHVAVLGYGNLPDANKYRCILSTYMTGGRFEKIWDDSGSGAHADVGFFGNRPSPDSTDAMDANTFTATASHSMPNGAPRLLNGAFAINRLTISPNTENMAITLYQTPELSEIWNDAGSGADRDLAVWRSQGQSKTYSLGDIAVPGGRPVTGFVAKALKDDVFAPAFGFRRIWIDAGSGADWDGAFWQPQCPYKYRALGYVAMRNHWQTPPADSFRCVKEEYTVSGSWQLVWRDHGSGADVDVGVWRAAAGRNGQGIEAMSVVAHWGNMDRQAFVLDSSIVNYVLGKPATKYILQNVRYNIDDRKVGLKEPESLARTIVENQGSTVQTVTRQIDYTYSETVSWGGSASLAIGVTSSVTAGVPSIAETSVSVSVEATVTQEWGESTEESKSDSVSVAITVQPNSQKSAIITGQRYQADIPYTAQLITEYADGTRGINNNFSGVFQGVQVNEIRVIYEDDVPLSV